MATFNKNTIFWDVAGSGQSFRYVSSNANRHTYARYTSSGTIDATNTISYDESDYKWRDENLSDHPGGFFISTTLNSNPPYFNTTSSATGTNNTEYIHVSNHYGIYWFAFQMAGWSASSGPTVTDITIVTPYEYNDGVNHFWVDGEFVTNDTITASDCTLYNDFQSYASSNITIVGNKFGITKSGTGVYGISVGGAHATIDYVDDSWLATVNSNSSSRSTNAMRIREVLGKIPDDIKFYRLVEVHSPQQTGLPHARGPYVLTWKTFDQLGWERIKFPSLIRYKKKWANTNPNNTSAWYPNSFTEQHVFELAEINNEIQWRFTRYKYWDDLSANHSASANVLYSPWFEVGEHPYPNWIWSYDINSTRYGVSNYDQWLVDERYILNVSDWTYYQEPEGDDEGPDGNPPNNTPPGDNMPNDPPGDPDPPKHQYPGDWRSRRRAHSFW